MFVNATYRLKASHYKYQKINRLKLDVHQDRNREAMKERERGEEETGKEAERRWNRGWGLWHGERNKERRRTLHRFYNVYGLIQPKSRSLQHLKARFTKRVLRSLARLRASLQVERKNYGHQHHYAIHLPPSDSLNQFWYVFLHFSRFGYEILLFIEFFCWIGLDLILVLIPFCFPSLSLSLFSNICVLSFFFPGVLIWKTGFDLENNFWSVSQG